MHRVPDERGERGRLRTLAADVGDGQRPALPLLVEVDVVEVAADVDVGEARVRREVAPGARHPGDLRELAGQQGGLQRARDQALLLVERGVVEGECGRRGELAHERQVLLAEAPPRLGLDEGERPEAAAPDQQRHDDRGAHPELADQLEVGRVDGGRDEELVGDLRQDDRLAGAGHVDGAAAGVGVARVAALEPLDELDLVGVEVRHGDLLDAGPADEVHGRPVGDPGDGEVRELAEALLHRQRGLHQPARLRQERHAVALALGRGARVALGGVEPGAVERLGAQRGDGEEERAVGGVEGPRPVEAEDGGAEIAVLGAQGQDRGALVAHRHPDRGHLRIARAPLRGVLEPHRLPGEDRVRHRTPAVQRDLGVRAGVAGPAVGVQRLHDVRPAAAAVHGAGVGADEGGGRRRREPSDVGGRQGAGELLGQLLDPRRPRRRGVEHRSSYGK